MSPLRSVHTLPQGAAHQHLFAGFEEVEEDHVSGQGAAFLGGAAAGASGPLLKARKVQVPAVEDHELTVGDPVARY